MPLDLYDPDTYVTGAPHDTFAALRAEAPLHWVDIPGQAGYWAVLSHEQLVEVGRQPELFSAYEGGIMLEDLPQESLDQLRGMLLAMDPPKHGVYRRPLTPHFKAKVMAGLEDRIRVIASGVIDAAVAKGDVEFVHDVTSHLPSQVIGELMGLPADDRLMLHRLAEQNTSGQDPDLAADPEQAYSATVEMAIYAIQLAERRRASGEVSADLTSVILGTDFGGAPMSEIDFGVFFVQLVTAANDTTKTMLSSGLDVLLDHPDALAAMRADHALVPGAVEEILRFANPLHYFRRTAMADCVLGGVEVAEGDKLAMLYTAANRDPAVFADPDTFDIRRHPNHHLAFGVGEHFCLGVHLARLEGRVFFEELLSRTSAIERTGPTTRVRSNLNNALKSLPVRLSA